MRRWRTTEHENGLQKSGVISYHSFDGQPSFSLGTDVVDPLTMNLLSSAKSLRPVLCAREAHLFSEQTPRHRELMALVVSREAFRLRPSDSLSLSKL